MNCRLCLSQISVVKLYFSPVITEDMNLRETIVSLLQSAIFQEINFRSYLEGGKEEAHTQNNKIVHLHSAKCPVDLC